MPLTRPLVNPETVKGFFTSYHSQPNTMDTFDELDIDTSDLESFLR